MIFKQFFQTALFMLSISSVAFATAQSIDIESDNDSEAADTHSSRFANLAYQFKKMPKSWLVVGNIVALAGMYACYHKEIKKVGFKNFVKTAWKNKRNHKKLWIPLTLLALVDAGYAGLQYGTPTWLMSDQEIKDKENIERYCGKEFSLEELKAETINQMNLPQEVTTSDWFKELQDSALVKAPMKELHTAFKKFYDLHVRITRLLADEKDEDARKKIQNENSSKLGVLFENTETAEQKFKDSITTQVLAHYQQEEKDLTWETVKAKMAPATIETLANLKEFFLGTKPSLSRKY